MTATLDTASFSARDFRNAMGQFASGVVVISAMGESGAHAMTANAFMSGSLEPPLVVISVAVTARMHGILQEARGFGVSILGKVQERTSNHFAGRRSPDYEPAFVNLDGMPTVAGASVRLAATTVHAYPCGDHTLFVGHVRALEQVAAGEVKPLLYHSGRYAALSPSDWSAEGAARLWPEVDGPAW